MLAMLKKFAPQVTVVTLVAFVGALGKYNVIPVDLAGEIVALIGVVGTHVAKGMNP